MFNLFFDMINAIIIVAVVVIGRSRPRTYEEDYEEDGREEIDPRGCCCCHCCFIFLLMMLLFVIVVVVVIPYTNLAELLFLQTISSILFGPISICCYYYYYYCRNILLLLLLLYLKLCHRFFGFWASHAYLRC